MTAEPNAQESRDSRRRSMLPQKTTTKSSSTRMLAVTEHDSTKEESVLNAKVKESKNGSVLRDDTFSMLPPSTLGRTRSLRDAPSIRQSSRPSSATSSRRSSMAKASAPDLMKTPARPRDSSGAKASTAANRVMSHGRSVSHQIVPTPASRLSSLPSTAPGLRQSSLKTPRPAFSTMQQHFSPKKATTMSSTKPMVKPADQDQIAVDFFPLQMELTQLHLIHRSAATLQKDWERSAEGFFQNRFDDLCARHVELKEVAHQQQTLLNQLALVEWCQGKPSNHVAEKVQQLSRNIADISSLLNSEGKYTRILEVFQSWFDQAERIQRTRNAGAKASGRDVTFIEGIGDGWKAEAMVLERELTYSLREIKGFGKVRGESSLGHILELQERMVSNLLDEMDVIQWIEHDMMVKESAWMEDAINTLSSNVSNDFAS